MCLVGFAEVLIIVIFPNMIYKGCKIRLCYYEKVSWFCFEEGDPEDCEVVGR
jgi:hypothetical protein